MLYRASASQRHEVTSTVTIYAVQELISKLRLQGVSAMVKVHSTYLTSVQRYPVEDVPSAPSPVPAVEAV